MSRTNCIDRAGQILIFCIWIEKRLVDLLILKKHPRLIKKVNTETEQAFPYTFNKDRSLYWEKSSFLVLNQFIKEFNPKKDWKENLENIFVWRDIIAHSYISLYKPYLLYRPDTKKKGKKPHELKKILLPTKTNKKSSRKFTLLLMLSDDDKFNQMVRAIEEIDQVYLRYEAVKLGINYEILR
jgi:hypothetical protein